MTRPAGDAVRVVMVAVEVQVPLSHVPLLVVSMQ